MLMRFDQEPFRHPLFTRMHEAADRVVHVGVEAGAQPVGSAQRHLKIVSSRLNIGNATVVAGFLGFQDAART